MFSYDSTGGVLGPTQIRLLHLLPATDNNPIECRLEVVALEENPVYEALSYCWGDNSQPQHLKCNNEAFQVTENLFSALRHLRNEHTERTLWVDAICINQEDLEERQSQVKLMKNIYTKSERVVIWLGPDPASDGVNHLFELIESTENLARPQLSQSGKEFFDKHAVPADVWYQGVDAAKNDFVVSDRAKKGAVAILKRPWWSRVWTLQEMALAPSAVIICGSLAASLLDVKRTVGYVIAYAISNAFNTGNDEDVFDLEGVFYDIDGMLSVAMVRLRRSFSTNKELGVLLHLLRWLRAKDPRDKVYGSLGIAASTYGIEPDYSISTVECYTRAAINIISGSRSLEIFSALRRPSCIKSTLTGLPSWVPDWSYDLSSVPDEEKGNSILKNPIMRENERTPKSLETRDTFPEEKAADSSMPFTARLLSDGKTLILKGVIVDELNAVGDKLGYPYEGPELPPENLVTDSIRHFKRNVRISEAIGGTIDTIQGWKNLAFKTENLQRLPGETRMDAFLTTMLSNRIRLSANRREVLEYLEESIKAGFELKTTTGSVMNQLHLSHLAPKLYRQLLGYKKASSIQDYSELWKFGKSFADVQWALEQRMATTGSGYLCLVPWPTQVGDKIALLQGGRTPYVLRKTGEKWKILGDCYVHGIMSGEAWSDDKCVDIEII